MFSPNQGVKFEDARVSGRVQPSFLHFPSCVTNEPAFLLFQGLSADLALLEALGVVMIAI